MNKLFIAIATIAMLSIATTASAQDTNDAGGFGFGVDRVVYAGPGGFAALPGVSFRYNLNNLLVFEGIFGMNNNSFTIDPDEGDSYTVKNGVMNLSLIVDYRLTPGASTAMASAYGGIGINQWNTSNDLGEGYSVSYMDLGLEIGLRGEVWLSDLFSIHGRFGFAYDGANDGEHQFNENNENATDNMTYKGTSIAFRGDLLGSMGFTFWMQ